LKKPGAKTLVIADKFYIGLTGDGFIVLFPLHGTRTFPIGKRGKIIFA